MPYGRGRYRNKRGGRRMVRTTRANDLGNNVYYKAYSQMRRDLGWLMSVVNVETKYIDTLFNANTMTNGIGNQSLLNGCQQGNTGSTRSGQSVKSQKVIMDFICAVGVTTPVNCRVCLIQDKAANGAAITASNVFQAAVDGASDYSTAQRNVATVGSRVVFHYDFMFQLDTVQNTSRVIRTTIPLKFHTKYNTGNAGGVADISENSLYLLCLSSAGATQPTFKGSVRYEFTDN